MSTPAAASTPAPANGHAVSPAEYVRGLTPEDKQAVFLALLREALQYNGDAGLLPIDDEAGKPFGYYVPPRASEVHFRTLAPVLTADQRDVTARALADLSNTFEMEAYLTDLEREGGPQG
jgi:hypothetical protein